MRYRIKTGTCKYSFFLMYCTKLCINGVYEKNTSVPNAAVPPQLSEKRSEDDRFVISVKHVPDTFQSKRFGLIPKQCLTITSMGYHFGN